MTKLEPPNTISWIAVIVSVVVFCVGLVLNVDARRINERYSNDHDILQTIMNKDTQRDQRIVENAKQLATLLEITRANSANIADLRAIIQKHLGM